MSSTALTNNITSVDFQYAEFTNTKSTVKTEDESNDSNDNKVNHNEPVVFFHVFLGLM